MICAKSFYSLILIGWLGFCATIANGQVESNPGELLAVFTDKHLPTKVRAKAGETLLTFRESAATKACIPFLITMIGDVKDDSALRYKALCCLKNHGRELQNYPQLLPALDSALAAEPKLSSNKLFRYESANILGVFQEDKVKSIVMDTILEGLHDAELRGVSHGIACGPNGCRKFSIPVDSRTSFIVALNYIGQERVLARPEIVDHLHTLSNNPDILPDFQDRVKAYLKEISQQ